MTQALVFDKPLLSSLVDPRLTAIFTARSQLASRLLELRGAWPAQSWWPLSVWPFCTAGLLLCDAPYETIVAPCAANLHVLPSRIRQDPDAGRPRSVAFGWVQVLEEADNKQHVIILRIEETRALRSTCTCLLEPPPSRLHLDVRSPGRPDGQTSDVTRSSLHKRILPAHRSWGDPWLGSQPQESVPLAQETEVCWRELSGRRSSRGAADGGHARHDLRRLVVVLALLVRMAAARRVRL